jgi:CubicO group peptidase (beta-lactamase class C family)
MSILGIAAVIGGAGVGIGAWKRNDIKRLLAVNALFSEKNIITNFSNMEAIFFNTNLGVPDAPASELPHKPQTMPEGLGGWIDDRSVTALVVLKDGKIAHEDYFKDTAPEDLRISWSVAKSFLSALMGIVVADGDIESIDDPVTKYATSLAGSAYEGATIRNVLNMASGVTFDEDYLSFSSDINKMGRVLALGGSMDKFAAGLKGRDRDAGVGWQYVSIDTHVIGMIIRGATGREIPELMAEKLLAPLGLEVDPLYLTDGKGVAFVLGGLNLRTRDYARFGQMFAQGGMYNGQQVVPADWVAASTAISAPTEAGETQYGYQWWLAEDAKPGEYFARGIYGQYIYIDTASNVVVAANSVDRAFEEDGSFEQNLAMFREIATKLS